MWWTTVLLFVSTYQGLVPGKSTRADVEKAFGAPARPVADNVLEYRIASGGALEVEYRGSDHVIDRMERRFDKPVSRAALVRSLSLPEAAEETRTSREGKLVEYWGEERTIALTYATGEVAGGVDRIGYFSLELYGKSLEMARNPQVRFNPAECRDVYLWAQQERDAAKRARNPVRHQAILEVQIVSQRGDCAAARKLTAEYKKSFH